MIKQGSQIPVEVLSNRFGGNGEVRIKKLLDPEQFHDKGRLFAHNVLAPGSSIGWHEHNGDAETYYILKGEGTFDDNGKKFPVKTGDVMFTSSGESHSLENTGTTDLEFIALILYI